MPVVLPDISRVWLPAKALLVEGYASRRVPLLSEMFSLCRVLVELFDNPLYLFLLELMCCSCQLLTRAIVTLFVLWTISPSGLKHSPWLTKRPIEFWLSKSLQTHYVCRHIAFRQRNQLPFRVDQRSVWCTWNQTPQVISPANRWSSRFDTHCQMLWYLRNVTGTIIYHTFCMRIEQWCHPGITVLSLVWLRRRDEYAHTRVWAGCRRLSDWTCFETSCSIAKERALLKREHKIIRNYSMTGKY